MVASALYGGLYGSSALYGGLYGSSALYGGLYGSSALYGVKHVLAVQLAVKGWHCVHMGMQFQQG